jgi:hypothetical protein
VAGIRGPSTPQTPLGMTQRKDTMKGASAVLSLREVKDLTRDTRLSFLTSTWTRRVDSDVSCAPVLFLQFEVGFFEDSGGAVEEAVAEDAVDDAMVVRERQVHH